MRRPGSAAVSYNPFSPVMMMKLLLFAPVLIVLAAISPLAQPSEVIASTGADRYTVDGAHSSAIFRVQHVGAAFFYGRFNHVEGELTLDPAALDDSRVVIKVRAESVDTNSADRDKHVRSPDFLDAAQFPWITFSGDEFTAVGDGSYDVTGVLQMRGVDKKTTIRVEHTGTGRFRNRTRVGYEAVFALQRSDFGINYGLEKKVLGDEVRLMFGLEMLLEE